MPGKENCGIMDSIREQIIQAFVLRMAVIRTTNGYNTDCGQNVNRAIRTIDPDALPALIVWPRKDENDPFYQQTGIAMPVDVEMYMAQRIDMTPSKQSEQMLADVIEAAMGPQYAVEFTDGATEPDAGDTLVGNTSEAEIFFQSASVTSGSWSGGDAAGTLTARRKNGLFAAELVSISGGAADVMTFDTVTGTGSIDLAAGGLARGIYYLGGGTDTYPDSDNDTVAVQANFRIVYHTADGDPYRTS
jgi:hypothetical protein